MGLCSARPADWWDPADVGARLALYLCRVCPALKRCEDESSTEYGVIRAGKAYGDDGKVLPLCSCGYPNRHRRGGGRTLNPLCHRCAVPTLAVWTPKTKRWLLRYLAGGTEDPSPCGTRAAAARHRARHERLDDACRAAENAYNRDWKRKARAA